MPAGYVEAQANDFVSKQINQMGKVVNDPYRGVIVPMVTPLTEDHQIDKASAKKLIHFLMDHHAIPFILGTTGESSYLPQNLRKNLVNVLVENRRDGIPLIAGVMGLSMKETVAVSIEYFSMGVEAVVISLPCSYSLRDHQVESYYSSIADQVNGDLILYNIPKLAHQSISIPVADQLSYRPNIIGIKDSEPDETRLAESLQKWAGRTDFFHLTGVNVLMLKGLLMGSRGIVPSTGNLCPERYHEMYCACKEGLEEKAVSLHEETARISSIYQRDRTLGESLAALKILLSEMDLCQVHMIPPLTCLTNTEKNKLLSAFKELQ